MNTATIDKLGLAPVQAELARIDALASKADVPGLLAHYQRLGIKALFSFGEQQDFKNARKQIGVIDAAGLGLPERDYYLRTGAGDVTIRAQYLAHVTAVLHQLGSTPAQAATGAQKILDFETALATATLDITAQRDPKNIYHLTPVADLAKLTPGFAWPTFFAAVGGPAMTEVNVAQPAFFTALDQLLAATDLATLKLYFRYWVVLSTPGTALPAALDAESFNFYSHQLRGTPQQQPRWKRCSAAVDNALGEALGQLYVAQSFPPASKAATQQMVRDIEAAME